MTAIQRFALHGTIMNPHSSGPYVRHEDHLAAMQGRCLAQIEEPAGAAPAAVAPQGEYPHEQMDAMALARYKVVPSHASMLWSHAVVAGDGAQQLYVGREVECQNMARKFAGAFLDGAFAFHSMAAAPTAHAAPALEAPAAPAGWKLVPEKPTDAMLGAAQKAWLADPLRRSSTVYAAALAAAPQAHAAPGTPPLTPDEARWAARSADNMRGPSDTTSGTEYVMAGAMALAAKLAAAPQAPAAQVIENLLQLARIVNTAVEDWGESFEDGSSEVTFHKEEADKLEGILEFFDSLPDAPPEEDVIESGPLRAARVLRSLAAPAAPAVDAKAHDWRENASYGGEICSECGAAKGSRRGNAPCAWPPEPLDVCTDPYNCARCKTHPAHRGDMHHAGISRNGGSA